LRSRSSEKRMLVEKRACGRLGESLGSGKGRGQLSGNAQVQGKGWRFRSGVG
jgi:hypothetical protein